MKTKFAFLLLILLGWNCKQQPETKKSNAEVIKQEPKTTHQVTPIIKELLVFADLNSTDTTDINEIFVFKEIDATGSVTEIGMNGAIARYKKLTKRGQATSLPIFELKDTETAILAIQGVGFGGAIWAKVLVDKKNLEIKKVDFEHQAESEGYGAAFAQNTFENQFVGTKINLEMNSFSLQKTIEKMNDNGHIIDGISGATMTSQGAVEMVNEGMKNYRYYLSQANGR